MGESKFSFITFGFILQDWKDKLEDPASYIQEIEGRIKCNKTIKSHAIKPIY